MLKYLTVTNQNREIRAEENEPYLGPAWAAVMFVLYLLKRLFPADQYSMLWWFQTYIISIVVAITIFTLIKRHQFYKQYKANKFINTGSNPGQQL